MNGYRPVKGFVLAKAYACRANHTIQDTQPHRKLLLILVLLTSSPFGSGCKGLVTTNAASGIPQLAANMTSLNFTDVAVGSSAAQTLTLTNEFGLGQLDHIPGRCGWSSLFGNWNRHTKNPFAGPGHTDRRGFHADRYGHGCRQPPHCER